MSGMANAQFTLLGRLMELNWKTMKAGFETSADQVREMLDKQEFLDWVSLSSAAMRPHFANAISYWRGLYELAMRGEEDLIKQRFRSNVHEYVDHASRSATQAVEVADAAMKSFLSAASAQYNRAGPKEKAEEASRTSGEHPDPLQQTP